MKLLFLSAVVVVINGVSMAQPSPELGLRGNRFRALTWQELSGPQRAMAEELMSGKRGSLRGPFNVFLRSPEVGNHLQRVGEHVRFRSSLSPRLNEMAILMTARWWLSQYEWYAHEPLARNAGLSEEIIRALRSGTPPSRMDSDEAALFGFCTEIRERRRVSDATFSEAIQRFGERGVMDLIALLGYYDAVSIALNVDGYPLPEGEVPPFEEPR
jgi:4-carboxymuconolactone decarboxylase